MLHEQSQSCILIVPGADTPANLNGDSKMTLYTVELAQNAQPAIIVDQIALYRLAESHATVKRWTCPSAGREYVSGRPHISYGNRGERRVHGVTDVDGFCAAVRATGAKTRKCKGYVKVTPPPAVTAEWRRLGDIWQGMAAQGRTDWHGMKRVLLNA